MWNFVHVWYCMCTSVLRVSNINSQMKSVTNIKIHPPQKLRAVQLQNLNQHLS